MKRIKIVYKTSVTAFLVSNYAILTSCNKIVQVKEPIYTTTTSEVFATEANANSSMTAIYSDMSYPGQLLTYANGATTIAAGESADELNAENGNYANYNTNTLLPIEEGLLTYFWAPIYSNIYRTNAVIEGLQGSGMLSITTKNQLTGEAKFIRAFSYFYLVNLFGDVPLATTTAWYQTDTLHRTPVSKVYQQIIADLTDAENLLRDDYSISGGERIRANKWAAAALLARVYLYTGDWKNAEAIASAVIGHSVSYGLVTDLDSAFLKNNREAILQLQQVDQPPYATREGYEFIPPDNNSSVSTSLTGQLLAAFETNDLRRQHWVDSSDLSGVYAYYPYKYKIRQGDQGESKEYYTLLRLAEQYLIRAEARAMQNTDLPGAVSDLNIIRERAGLTDLPSGLNQDQVLAAVAQERRIELFCEWGHRWFDLKRTGKADEVLAPLKPGWKASAVLYPIPQTELIADPHLVQNPGY